MRVNWKPSRARNPAMATQIVVVRESAGQPVRPMEFQGARVEEIERKENIAMTTQTLTRPEANETEKQIKKLRELYADAPELGRTALESLLAEFRGFDLRVENLCAPSG